FTPSALFIIFVSPASYSKPRLEAQPAAIVTPGVNVTLRCSAPQPAGRFALFKSAEVNPLFLQDVSTELAEFFLEEVTPAQGGRYHCCYRKTDWGLDVWSQSSDILELLVTDQLPRPSLVALPGPVVVRGANVSLRCAGQVSGMSFALYRVGVAAPLQYRDSKQPWADFLLPGDLAPGTYSCYYHTPSAPYVLSQRSQPLVISLEESVPLDYTQGNLIRLGLASLVLILLGALVAFDWRRRNGTLGDILPPGNWM
uniref:Osteoclast-associated immunoglobulin-like receptor n=1 Tax=Castor canadensis TaxID=51338 RepID=A0A8C0ZUN6_CASCN